MDRIIERAAIGFFTGLGIIVGLSVLWYELKTVVGLAAWLWGLFGALLILLGVAGPLESGAAAYQKGVYAAAIGYWRPLANEGNADAQASLGMMYLKGQGVAQDDAQAVAWLHKAADNGHAGAQNNLGLITKTARASHGTTRRPLFGYVSQPTMDTPTHGSISARCTRRA